MQPSANEDAVEKFLQTRRIVGSVNINKNKS